MNLKAYGAMLVFLAATAGRPVFAAQEAECRGVAAGVVAALRASGEVVGEDAVEAAILGARRGCEAAMMSGVPSGGDGPANAAKAEDEGSFWNIFGDGDDADEGDPASENPGIERLKRLRN